MVLTLLRHGAPHPAHHGRYNGHSDLAIDPALFDPATIAPLREKRFDAVYSSDLIRCTQTLEAMGIEEYATDPRLREVRFKASVEGKTFDEVAAFETFRPSLLENEERWHDFLCAEPRDAFEGRIREFLATLSGAGEILLCTHGGAIRAIVSLLAPSKPFAPPGHLEYIVLEHSRIS